MEDYIIGIDLGTTYSCLAYIDAAGSVVIEKNSEGDDTTPSAIIFDGEDHAVGKTAKNMAPLNPEGFVDMIKRDMGTDRSRTINGQEFTPSKLSAFILRTLIDNFNGNHECEIKRAVISVPAYFGDAEREATVYAGKIAGLDEVSLIPEPVAASISYGILDATSDRLNVLVYDLGGGTFDATVLKIEGVNYTTLSVDGDKYLGGKDWDSRLIDLIMSKVADEPSNGLTMEDLEDDPEVRINLKLDAELRKKDLTNLPKIRGTLRCGPKNVVYSVTQEEFESATRDLLMKTISISKNAIAHSKLTENDIDVIVLVGGSSRMPQVKKILEQEFPGKKFKLYDPDLAVAKGAALYATSKIILESENGSEQSKVRENYGDVIDHIPKVNVTTVLAKTYGVEALNADDEYRVYNILFRNHAIPTEAKDRFSVHDDDQPGIRVAVYENEAYEPEDGKDDPLLPTDCNLIGEFHIALPPNVKAGEPVLVTMTITDDKNLSCVAECCGRRGEHSFQYKGIHQSADDLMRERQSLN